MFLIFKEILNNIVRHANATAAVHVDLTVAPRELHLRVTDDGVGFDPAGTAEGHGLRSMQRRASSLRGAIEVTSRRRTGTCVTLTASRWAEQTVSRLVAPAPHPYLNG